MKSFLNLRIIGVLIAFAALTLISENSFAQARHKTTGIIVLAAHQDDDVLWFRPFLRSADQIIIAGIPAHFAHLQVVQKHPDWYRKKWLNLWGAVSLEEYVNTFLNPPEYEKIVNRETLKERLKDIISQEEVKIIVTHSPWGEYGHWHHRMLFAVAWELAVEYEKTLLVPGFVVRTPDIFIEESPSFGIETVIKHFNKRDYFNFREIYLKEDESLIGTEYYEKYGVCTWTYTLDPDHAPLGYLPFLKIVDVGVDNYVKSIEFFSAEVPIFGR